jgi:hypothetical protein
MMNRRLAALSVWLGLLAAMAAGPSPAAAQTCYSAAQTRAAVQSGQVQPLSAFLGEIRGQVDQVLGGGAQLCMVNGRLKYGVQVLVQGRATTLWVDAQTGAMSY